MTKKMRIRVARIAAGAVIAAGASLTAAGAASAAGLDVGVLSDAGLGVNEKDSEPEPDGPTTGPPTTIPTPTDTPPGPTDTPPGPTDTPPGPTDTPPGPTDIPTGPTGIPPGPTSAPGPAEPPTSDPDPEPDPTSTTAKRVGGTGGAGGTGGTGGGGDAGTCTVDLDGAQCVDNLNTNNAASQPVAQGKAKEELAETGAMETTFLLIGAATMIAGGIGFRMLPRLVGGGRAAV
ncbi:hypothetical protein [Streptomyces sp. NPDC020965]|uniref:hypothetical protein n=1 Tax=Streptomyces sp. NPDC020965 TaxID=3365105 RepID=UPI00378CFB84